MSESIYLIYKLTSPSGKSYIGQTNNLTRRINEHRHRTACKALHHAITKYGFDSFQVEILTNNLSFEMANTIEIQLINEHNTLVPNGYNIQKGGHSAINEQGQPLSDEHKLNISKSRKGSNNRTGIKQTQDHINKRVASIIGKPRSDEIKQKISDNSGSRGRIPWNKGLKLPPQSNETKQKRSKSTIGRNMAHNKGKKWKLDPETGRRIYFLPE